MIKAAGRTTLGTPLLLLGLSGENVARLTAGETILVRAEHLNELGLPQLEVVIHYGRTEKDILNDLSEHGITLKNGGS